MLFCVAMGDVQVTIRLPADALARIDKLVQSAASSGNPLIARLSRSQMMRAVVEFGIDQAERQYATLLSTSDSPGNRTKSAPRHKPPRGGS
jgi:hypothetical protein